MTTPPKDPANPTDGELSTVANEGCVHFGQDLKRYRNCFTAGRASREPEIERLETLLRAEVERSYQEALRISALRAEIEALRAGLESLAPLAQNERVQLIARAEKAEAELAHVQNREKALHDMHDEQQRMAVACIKRRDETIARLRANSFAVVAAFIQGYANTHSHHEAPGLTHSELSRVADWLASQSPQPAETKPTPYQVIKQGSHVAVGEYRPLADDFRPAGAQPAEARAPRDQEWLTPIVDIASELAQFDKPDWHQVGDGAFARPFGTVRVCIDCGCLVAGGPTRCGRCASVVRVEPAKCERCGGAKYVPCGYSCGCLAACPDCDRGTGEKGGGQ